jgi:short-subunit dehydrogenase
MTEVAANWTSSRVKMNDIIKYAVVTGASSGIGWHISKELAIKGYSIVAVSNQPEELNQLKADLEGTYQIKVLPVVCDLTDYGAAEYIFDFCQKENIWVEVLVNNAGILVFGEVLNINIKKTQDILQLHMVTPVMLCRLFGEAMVRNQKGYILNVSSISAVMPYPTISLYGPTKTFLRKFTRALRTEMKGGDVSVSCLLPGATATALHTGSSINMPLAIRSGVIKKPEIVAKAGITALFNKKAECIPGLMNKFIMLFIPLIPNFIIGVIYKIYSKKAR